MSPSSWMATAVGRPSAGCRASRGTGAGVEAIRRAVRTAGDLGIRYLTVYSFSAENWRRPAQEVSDLMGLLKRFVRHDLAELHANNIRVRIIGEREGLASDIRAAARRGRAPHARQYGPDPRHRLQLWRAPGNRRAPCVPLPDEVKEGTLDPAAIDMDTVGSRSRHPRHPGSRSRHPHLGRAAGVELPDLADGLFRIRLPARFWPDFDEATFKAAIDEYLPARPPLRRPERPGGLTMVADQGSSLPSKPKPAPSQELTTRVLSAIVMIAVALLTAYLGRLALRTVLARCRHRHDGRVDEHDGR